MMRIWFLLCVSLWSAGCARSTPPLNQLVEACGKGDKAQVQAMLTAHPEMAKAARPDGYTALHEAIMASKDELVPLLLEAGANPNQVKGNGNQPLHAAVHKLKPETIKLLIDKGAKVDGRAPNGDTPLIIAAGIQRLDVAQVLLENKADPNLQNLETGAFALYHAAFTGNVKLLKLLLEKGAKLDLKLKTDQTALHAAVLNGNEEGVRALLEAGANLNLPDSQGATPLAVAVDTGQLKLIDLLLERGADPSIGVTMQLAQSRKEALARLKAAKPKTPKAPK